MQTKHLNKPQRHKTVQNMYGKTLRFLLVTFFHVHILMYRTFVYLILDSQVFTNRYMYIWVKYDNDGLNIHFGTLEQVQACYMHPHLQFQEIIPEV